MKKIFTIFTVFAIIICYSQNTIDIAAKWNKGDHFKIKFISEITDIKNKIKSSITSTFNSNFTVDNLENSKINVTWVYTNAVLDAKENNLENIIISKIINQPLKIRFSEYGKYEELENISEIRNSVSKIIDNEISKTAVDSKKAVLNIAKNLISTDQGLEILVTKNIKAYFFSFGYEFVENKIDTHSLQIPNPFGGDNFPANETVKMTKVDENLKTCFVTTSKIADGEKLKAFIIDLLKKNSKKSINEIDSQLKNLPLEFSENSEHEINYEKGIVINGFYKRTMNFGIQDRVQLLKFSLQK